MIGKIRLTIVFASMLAGTLASADAQEGDSARMTDEARKVATSLLQQIGGELKKEYEISGPLRSVIVCRVHRA